MTLLQKLFIWLGTRFFNYIDIRQEKDEIRAITFSKDKWYINKVNKIEKHVSK